MGARNCQELGANLQKICNRLLANDNLINLLYYEDLDPLNQPHLNEKEKQKLLNDLVHIVPKVSPREDSRSVIAIYIPEASSYNDNTEFKFVTIMIDIFVPMTQWIIKDTNLRPFAIMGEIQSALNGKTVNGLGKIEGGDFELIVTTNEMSVYRQTFFITEYD